MRGIYVFAFSFVLGIGTLFGTDNPLLIVIGTRPEAIKLLPLYDALKKEQLPVQICSTGQHTNLVEEIFPLFGIKPSFELKVMKEKQDLFYLTQILLEKTKELFQEVRPSLVIVQGDTTSAFVAALSAFYLKIPVIHVEAGLRTYNCYAPFPEEINRQLISKIATLHFAPTLVAKDALKAERISEDSIFLTGNTGIDALFFIKNRLANQEIFPSSFLKEQLDSLKKEEKKIFLLTVHRRESLEKDLAISLTAIKEFLLLHPDLAILYPVHPNPAIHQIIEKVELQNLKNIVLLPPLSYHDLVYLLSEADAVLTDSGGIQEEAISLGIPTLVLRNETDRPEGLEVGIAKLVGTNPLLIRKGMEEILKDLRNPSKVNHEKLPYGDGTASPKIAKILKDYLEKLSHAQ